ncbi:MAG TPA: response regulator [Mycobacteriales bacterium]|nr:response regulator [Mycobacteriales bacterium]
MPKQGTLLIVDDSPAVCAALRTYMSRVEGWPTVLTAGDAAAGLDLAVVHEPTAIVLDNKMPPGRDGIDLLAELRLACPAARIVMHTSEDTTVLRERAVRLGADAIVPKGQPLDELAALIKSA